MKVRTAYSVLALAVLLVVGVFVCNQGQVMAGEPIGITPVLPGILLNEDDNGAVQPAQVGDYLLICLQDPWGAAYGWKVVDVSGDGVVRQIGAAQHMPGPGDWSWGQDTGKPDTAYFRLTAVSEGQATVSIVCTPPPGIMAPVRFYQVTVDVRAP